MPGATSAQGWNRYSYVNNNPIVYIDPTGHFLDFIGDALGWVAGAVSSAANWAYNAACDTARFVGKATTIAWKMLVFMVTDPVTLATMVAGAILTITLVGLPAGLTMWAQATAAAIAATSVAQAAGVTNPLVLSLIGALAGAAGGGATQVKQFFKTVVAWGVGQGLQEIEGGSLAKYMSIVNALGSAVAVNTFIEKSTWAITLFGAVDPNKGQVSCMYKQSNGAFVCADASGNTVLEADGYSGRGYGLDNPGWENAPNNGPIPAGEYEIGSGYNGGLGKPQFNLTPSESNTMFDRGDFLIHGDVIGESGQSLFPSYWGSKGCIVLSIEARTVLNQYSGGTLTVIH